VNGGVLMSENEIEILVERVRRVRMSATEAEQQRRSFAYGNANIENADVTRELIESVAEELSNEDAKSQEPLNR
jgi:hypothetical protein